MICGDFVCVGVYWDVGCYEDDFVVVVDFVYLVCEVGFGVIVLDCWDMMGLGVEWVGEVFCDYVEDDVWKWCVFVEFLVVVVVFEFYDVVEGDVGFFYWWYGDVLFVEGGFEGDGVVFDGDCLVVVFFFGYFVDKFVDVGDDVDEVFLYFFGIFL